MDVRNVAMDVLNAVMDVRNAAMDVLMEVRGEVLWAPR